MTESQTFHPAPKGCALKGNNTLRLCLISAALAVALPSSMVFANPDNTPEQVSEKSDISSDTTEVDEVVAVGAFIKGRSLSTFKPEIVFTESDIAAYGVSSIAELLRIIDAETSSGKTRRSEPPVVLINGRRVSGFRELDNYPVESLARVEVLPEEASLAYGFTANQRVINFILKSDLQIIPVNIRTQAPLSGGTLSNTVDVSHVFINGNNRSTIKGKFSSSSALLESERDIIPLAAEQPPFSRSLLPASDRFEVSGLRTFALPSEALGTVSMRYEDAEDRILTGLSSVDGSQLSQRIETETLDLGSTINSRLAQNTWSLIGQYQEINRKVENLGNLGIEFAPIRTTSKRAALDFNANFALFESDFGATTLSAAAGMSHEAFRSQTSDISITRDTFSLQGALSQPLPLSEDKWGRGSVTIDGRVRDLSDIGSLEDYGITANWIPIEPLTLTYSWSSEDIAPTLREFGLPTTRSPNQSFFDLTTAETVTATVLDGGNANLRATSRQISKLGVSWKPWEERDLTVSTDYIVSKSVDDIRRFTVPSQGLQAVGLDQVVRDPDGLIISLDRTPFNVFESERESLRSSLTWSIPIQPKMASSPPKSGAKRRRSGRPGARRLSLIHRWELKNQVTPVDKGIVLDLLDGDTINSNLARPRHLVDLTYYQWNNGWGFYGSAAYRSGASLTTGAGQLDFSGTMRVILSASYEFNYSDRILEHLPILEETRLTIGLSNVLNDIVTVEDDLGRTPLAYQKALLDPVGTGWRIELRKRF